MILKPAFYKRSAITVARELLGACLVRQIEETTYRLMIVETEAYEGPADKASHASRGKTERNAVMFGPAGVSYIYFTYGMHYLFNIVTGEPDYPAAVLLRALEPVSWQVKGKSKTGIPDLKTNGPARLTKALAIDRQLNHQPVYQKTAGLWLESGAALPDREVVAAKRVGVDYAEEYKDKLWRFYLKNNRFVSKK